MPNFTRQAIKASFMKLLNERPLSQITVKDIVEDCGINRNSFYYHFADLPALVEEIIKEDIDRVIQNYPRVESLEECLDVALAFGLKNKKAAYHIFNSVNRGILEQHLLNMCEYAVTKYIETAFPDVPVDEESRKLIIRHYKCACFGQIIDWMNSGMKDDLIEQFHAFCDLCKGMTAELLQRSMKKEPK